VSPEVHLPETILRMNVAFGAEKIIAILGVDVGNTKLIADNFNGGGQSCNVHFPGRLWKRSADCEDCESCDQQYEANEKDENSGKDATNH
jgi:hypothetical protein